MFRVLKSCIRRAFKHSVFLVLGMLPEWLVSRMLVTAMASLHRTGENWITIHKRPKRGCDNYYRPVNPIPSNERYKYGLVLQGPILHTDDFTLETIKYYRLLHPDSPVILSTWRDESEDVVQCCRDVGASVILNDMPSHRGALNVNCQILTSRSGLLRAKQLGCEYAAKTRTDCRIYAPDSFRFLANLLSTFPCRPDTAQQSRIISTAWTTSRYAPFILSDHFIFGAIDDVCNYWNAPANTEHSGETFDCSIRSVNPDCIPEMYLCRSFINRSSDNEVPITLRAWWQALADRFLIVDREMLDMYWPKHFPHAERLSEQFEDKLVMNNLRFRDWLRLYREFGHDTSVPEHLLDLPAGSLPPFRLI